jgi:hypothetical protein
VEAAPDSQRAVETLGGLPLFSAIAVLAGGVLLTTTAAMRL